MHAQQHAQNANPLMAGQNQPAGAQSAAQIAAQRREIIYSLGVTNQNLAINIENQSPIHQSLQALDNEINAQRQAVQNIAIPINQQQDLEIARPANGGALNVDWLANLAQNQDQNNLNVPNLNTYFTTLERELQRAKEVADDEVKQKEDALTQAQTQNPQAPAVVQQAKNALNTAKGNQQSVAASITALNRVKGQFKEQVISQEEEHLKTNAANPHFDKAVGMQTKAKMQNWLRQGVDWLTCASAEDKKKYKEKWGERSKTLEQAIVFTVVSAALFPVLGPFAFIVGALIASNDKACNAIMNLIRMPIKAALLLPKLIWNLGAAICKKCGWDPAKTAGVRNLRNEALDALKDLSSDEQQKMNMELSIEHQRLQLEANRYHDKGEDVPEATREKLAWFESLNLEFQNNDPEKPMYVKAIHDQFNQQTSTLMADPKFSANMKYMQQSMATKDMSQITQDRAKELKETWQKCGGQFDQAAKSLQEADIGSQTGSTPPLVPQN